MTTLTGLLCAAGAVILVIVGTIHNVASGRFR